jgi:hypothetical protein
MSTEFKINWEAITQYYIQGKDLNDPYDICRIMKKKGTRRYVYSITHIRKMSQPAFVIKHGMSGDYSRNHGERVYRQFAHLKSWGDKRIKGSSGAEFRIILDDILEKYGIDVDHRDLIITIYDLTDYPFTMVDVWLEINKIEAHFINEHVRFFGEKPIGNISDEHNALFRPSIRKETFSSLFETGK